MKNKYNAKKTLIGGITFDSKKEATRYGVLVLLKRSGQIKEIELQPRFDIKINGKFCGFYKADFRIEWANGDVTIEDVKGITTPVYNLKKKIIEAMYGIKITEI